jgi:hypothetical protein
MDFQELMNSLPIGLRPLARASGLSLAAIQRARTTGNVNVKTLLSLHRGISSQHPNVSRQMVAEALMQTCEK